MKFMKNTRRWKKVIQLKSAWERHTSRINISSLLLCSWAFLVSFHSLLRSQTGETKKKKKKWRSQEKQSQDDKFFPSFFCLFIQHIFRRRRRGRKKLKEKENKSRKADPLQVLTFLISAFFFLFSCLDSSYFRFTWKKKNRVVTWKVNILHGLLLFFILVSTLLTPSLTDGLMVKYKYE